jgi:hypothetical protein
MFAAVAVLGAGQAGRRIGFRNLGRILEYVPPAGAG